MKKFFFHWRIQKVLPAKARCAICGQTDEAASYRDLDFRGRFLCHDCIRHAEIAESFLRLSCEFDTPSDDLIEQHL